MFVRMRMAVPVRFILGVRVFVLVVNAHGRVVRAMVRMALSLLMRCLRMGLRQVVALEDMDLGACNPAAVHPFDAQTCPQAQRGGRVREHLAGTPASTSAPSSMSPAIPAKQSMYATRIKSLSWNSIVSLWFVSGAPTAPTQSPRPAARRSSIPAGSPECPA